MKRSVFSCCYCNGLSSAVRWISGQVEAAGHFTVMVYVNRRNVSPMPVWLHQSFSQLLIDSIWPCELIRFI